MLKILTLQKKYLVLTAQFAVLLAISVLAPLFHFQPITGPTVNAVLFLAVLLLDVEWALMLCLLPSLIALSVGTLPVALTPMVPFIMTSNAILVISFYLLKRKNFALGVITASVLKFLFLFSTSYIVVNLISAKPIAAKAATMMSWPQLITALTGGLLVYLFIKILKKNVTNSDDRLIL